MVIGAEGGPHRLAARRARPDLDKLTHGEELFALEYLTNGYHATTAYKATHPRCRSEKAATVEGHRTLVKPRVQPFIQREIEARKKRLRMDADEALKGITRYARADIGDIFDDRPPAAGSAASPRDTGRPAAGSRPDWRH